MYGKRLVDKLSPKIKKVYHVVGLMFKYRLVLKILNWLGYYNESNGFDKYLLRTKHGASAYTNLVNTAAFRLVIEVVFAIISVLALARFISLYNVAIDRHLAFWISIGILRYLIIIFGSLFKYHSSKKTKVTSSGEVSVIGNAVYRKRYKPYIIVFAIAWGIFFVFWIPYLRGMIIPTTHNLWLSPFVFGFASFFIFTCLLNCLDILCLLCGFQPAAFDLDQKEQLKEAF